MEAMREQVAQLSLKVDSLYHAIEQLNDKLSESLSERKLTEPKKTERSELKLAERTLPYHSYSSLDPVLDHKDVLLDDNSSDKNSPSLERELTPDIQIQRLTAQLTAAYNRIASLEEQLLAKRIHT